MTLFAVLFVNISSFFHNLSSAPGLFFLADEKTNLSEFLVSFIHDKCPQHYPCAKHEDITRLTPTSDRIFLAHI